jgi:hypothetical protein
MTSENRDDEDMTPYTRGGLVCRVAESADSREQVYRLRHDCYLRRGSIDPRPDRKFSDSFDQTPNHFSFLVRNSAQQALATVRISVVRPDLGWTEAPARKVFGDHPAFETLARESFVEASRLCFGHQARRDSLMQLLGNMAALAELYEVEWLVACPRQEHAPIYQRLFGFRPLAEPRPYFGVKFDTQMLGVRRKELQSYVSQSKLIQTAWRNALSLLVHGPPCQAHGVTSKGAGAGACVPPAL